MSLSITADFDPSSIQAMARLAGADARLDVELISTLGDIGTDVLDAIPANMHFQHGSGRLEGSFEMTGSGMEREIGSSVAWSHRREFSFQGPDSLGRVFPNDPAGYFVRDAIDQVGPSIHDRLYTTADNALHP